MGKGGGGKKTTCKSQLESVCMEQLHNKFVYSAQFGIKHKTAEDMQVLVFHH